MIAEKNTATVTGNLAGDAARMTIDTEAMGHIMDLLTNAYGNPEQAVIREYATNGIDAHVEAGVKRPIEVQTPTSLDPYLRIRDYGTGLSREDIHAMYSKYGASSKRGTNEQTGMLGIGSKSGLAYADQFTLTSVKCGRKVSVAVSRDEDGGGTMTILEDRATAEGNGTEVTIPAPRSNNCEAEAEALFQYWPEGTVLLNGKPPHRLIEGEGIWIDDAKTMRVVPESGHNVVVMGNVAYPVEWDEHGLAGFDYRRSLAVFVPIGAVNFAPSREALRLTRRTKDTLAEVVEGYRTAVRTGVQKRIDEADTAAEALRLYAKWGGDLPGAPSHRDLTYRGTPFPENIDHPVHGSTFTVASVGSNRYYGRGNKGSSSRNKSIPGTTLYATLWITEYTVNWTADHYRKVQKYCADNDLGHVTQVVGVGAGFDPLTHDFIDEAQIVDWPTLRAVTPGGIDGATGRGYRPKRLTGSYDLQDSEVDHRTEVQANDVSGKPLVYFNGNRWSLHSRYRKVQAMGLGKTPCVVALPANRINKFKRDFPHAMSYDEAMSKAQANFKASLTPEQTLAFKYHDSGHYAGGRGGLYDNLRSLDPTRIDDPELTAAVKACMVDVRDLNRKRQAMNILPERGQVTNPLAKYPLYRADLGKHDHNYIYMNAVYAASQETA